MVRAAAEWAADPELAEYNMKLARLSAKESAKQSAKTRDRDSARDQAREQ
jgi:hypothetical protein